MRKIALAGALLAFTSLAACSPSMQKSIEDATTKICSGAAAIHVAYEASKGFIKVSAKSDLRVEAAFESMQPFCDGTATGDPGELAKRAAEAFATFLSAVNQAGVKT
jgi:hypothetical protein